MCKPGMLFPVVYPEVIVPGAIKNKMAALRGNCQVCRKKKKTDRQGLFLFLCITVLS